MSEIDMIQRGRTINCVRTAGHGASGEASAERNRMLEHGNHDYSRDDAKTTQYG
jgi:hypothetical protein